MFDCRHMCEESKAYRRGQVLHCLNCGSEIIQGNMDPSEYRRRRFCSISCSAKFNNKKRPRKSAKEIPQKLCPNCGKMMSIKNFYCSTKCQHEWNYKTYIEKWKNGEISGTTGKTWIDVSLHIRRFLFEKFNNKCSVCGWCEVNPFTGCIPLEIEHIDGDALNNREENLTLLCPNCHSLTKTYRGANKGHGTRGIKWMSRCGTTNLEVDITYTR